MNLKNVACANCRSSDTELFANVPAHRKVAFIAPIHSNVICRNCGLVYINPRHSDEAYERFYESTGYSAPIGTPKEVVLKNQKSRKKYADFLVAHLPKDAALSEKVRTLDVGCSMGVLPHFLKEAGFEVVGLEPSHYAGLYARENFGIPVTKGFLSDQSLGLFDLVTCTAVVEHLTDPLNGIRDMKAMIRPGGYLYLSTPDLRGTVLRAGYPSAFPFVHLFNFTANTLSSIVRQAGLSIVVARSTPPDLSRSSLITPGDFANGRLHILAKNAPPTSSEIEPRDDFREILALLKKSDRRDRLHRILYESKWAKRVSNGILRRLKKK